MLYSIVDFDFFLLVTLDIHLFIRIALKKFQLVL